MRTEPAVNVTDNETQTTMTFKTWADYLNWKRENA